MGFIENWTVIIDTNFLSIYGFPYNIMKNLVKMTQLNFAGNLHRMFVLNPSATFNTIYNFGKSIMNPGTTAKVVLLRQNDFEKMHTEIDKSQLLPQFGGFLKAPKSFWPVPNTLEANAEPVNESLAIEEDNLPNPMYILEEDQNMSEDHLSMSPLAKNISQDSVLDFCCENQKEEEKECSQNSIKQPSPAHHNQSMSEDFQELKKALNISSNAEVSPNFEDSFLNESNQKLLPPKGEDLEESNLHKSFADENNQAVVLNSEHSEKHRINENSKKLKSQGNTSKASNPKIGNAQDKKGDQLETKVTSKNTLFEGGLCKSCECNCSIF